MTHGRLSHLRVSLVLTGLISLAVMGCGPAPEEQTSIVLITLDTLRADHLGCYGYARARTPIIDGFAGGALRFDNAFSTINTTLASHAAMMTGKHPQTLGIPRNSFPLSPEFPTIAELLSHAGYRTAAFVSCSALASGMGLARGFKTYDETFDLSAPDQEQRRAEATTAAALRWLKRNTDGPFFLWVHYFDPHFPYEPPAPFDTIHDTGYQGPADGSMGYLEKLWQNRISPARADLQRLVDLYDGEIAYLDHCLEPLLDELGRPGLKERTLVAVTADHGEHLTERRLKFYHGNYVYQPSIRVPLLIRLPSAAARTGTVSETVQTIDLFRTLLGAAGVPAANGDRNQDLAGPLVPRPAFAEASRPWSVENHNPNQYQNLEKAAMVVRYPWKLVVTPWRRQVELYNLQQDPAERNNLAASQTDRARELHSLLTGWREGAGPPAPLPNQENLRRLETLGYVQ
jgi:arylsulfatase A-like enzyme